MSIAGKRSLGSFNEVKFMSLRDLIHQVVAISGDCRLFINEIASFDVAGKKPRKDRENNRVLSLRAVTLVDAWQSYLNGNCRF